MKYQTPIYLRDLSEHMQAEMLRDVTDKNILEAVENGDDVLVGYFSDTLKVGF